VGEGADPGQGRALSPAMGTCRKATVQVIAPVTLAGAIDESGPFGGVHQQTAVDGPYLGEPARGRVSE
jgi:hypothetical protein